MDVQEVGRMYVAETPAVDVSRRVGRGMEVPGQITVAVIRALRAVAR